ncbi:hypothetical protein PMAYCL1PPCAC_12965, partial [Pristionchus mayeri]
LFRDAFASYACSQCLMFIYFLASEPLRVKTCDAGLAICSPHEDPCDCRTPQHVFNLPEYTTSRNGSTPLSELPIEYKHYLGLPNHFESVVGECCKAAVSCCDNVLMNANANHSGTECPATWDGWQCFPRSPVGTVRAICPNYIYGHQTVEEREGVVKECTAQGWFRNEQRSEHSLYQGCAYTNHSKFFAGVFSYAISVIAIIPAVGILSVFRTLRTQAVYVIHKHLLISFLLLGIFYLFTSFMFIVKDAPLMRWHSENHVVCRLLFLTQLRFLRLSTFSWMLAEGVYLFRLLYKSFSDNDSLIVYKIVCWGFPLLVSIVYGILRLQLDDRDCWVTPSDDFSLEAIVMIPSLICIMLNLILVTVILYILVKKLRYNPHLEPMQYSRPPLFAIILHGGIRLTHPSRRDSWLIRATARHSLIPPLPGHPLTIAPDVLVVAKAVRAALMLVPVFGLHFLFTIYRMPSELHQIMNLIMDGLQGFAVSIILCYANNGVGEAVKKYIKDMKDLRTLRSECRTSNAGLTRSSIPNGKKKASSVHLQPICESDTIEFNISIHEGGTEGKRESQDYRQPLMTTTEEPADTNENSM